MPITKSEFVLRTKKRLTADVFELVFDPSQPLESKPGEYVMFELAPGVKRAYSIAFRTSDGAFGFVVKRVEGGAGSPILCGFEVGSKVPAMGPMGHFVLRDGDVPRCFIGTGTGFAPLYCQLLECARLGYASECAFAFGVRASQDAFYSEELSALRSTLPSLDVRQYLSREEKPGFEKGYVTDFLTPETASKYREFYLCGSPSMVKDTRSRLEELGIPKTAVFFEQY